MPILIPEDAVVHSSRGLQIRRRTMSRRVVLTVSGRFSFKGRRAILDAIEQVYAGGCRSIVLDLSEVSYFDNSMLGMLMMVRRKWHGAGRHVVLAELPENIRLIVRLAEIPRLIRVHPSVEAALRCTPPAG